MDRFCRQCGAALPEGDKFCRACGAKVPKAIPACSQCGKPLMEGDRFCRSCGESITPSPSQPPAQPTAQPQAPAAKAQPVRKVKPDIISKAAATLLGQSLEAPPIEGELAFEPAAAAALLTKPLAQVQKAIGPAASLLRGAAGFFKGIAAAFKDPRTLIIALAAAALWAIPLFLPALLDNKLFALLTYAGGGLKGGLPGFLGGLAGKGLIAYLIASLFQGGFKRIATGLKNLPASLSGKRGSTPAPLLLGLGLALIFSNFISYDGSPQASMATTSGLLITLQALGSKSGFLRLLGSSFTKGKNQNAPVVDQLLAGLALGSGLSLPLAATGLGFAGYLFGGLLLAGGLTLWLAKGRRKEELQ